LASSLKFDIIVINNQKQLLKKGVRDMKTKMLIIVGMLLILGAERLWATHYDVGVGDYLPDLNLINNDTLLMTGGELDGLDAYGTSTATILDTIPIEGLNAGIKFLDAYDSSTINFSGGSVWYFEGFDSSTINIDGGEILYLDMNESATAHLSGGQILTVLGIRDESSYTHIYGYDFDYDPLAGNYDGGLVTGFWPDGDPFDISLDNMYPSEVITYDQLIFHVIPEPATILLVGIGGLVLSRRSNM